MNKFKFLFLLFVVALLVNACDNKDDDTNSTEQVLEVYDVNGSSATAKLTVNGKVLFTTSVYIGKNGVEKTGEGDAKTPSGTMHITGAFGVKENPGTKINYLTVTPSIYACDEDCEFYNQIIDTAAVHHNCKGEDMYHIVPQYNYGLMTDFNKECKYPNGSNIFIHCKGPKTYTGGCIAFDEDKMIEILRNCDEKLVVKVVTSDGKFQ